MTALRGTITQDDFSGGFFRDVAPALIPEDGCYDLANGLLDEDGDPYRRGGTEYKSRFLPGAAPILDDFNRSFENPVDNGKWSGLETPAAELKVFSEQLSPSGLFEGSAAYIEPITDGVIYFTFLTIGPETGLWIRTEGEGDLETLRGYFVRIIQEPGSFHEGTGFCSLEVLRRDPGGNISPPIAVKTCQKMSVGDAFALMAVGSELSCWRLPNGGDWTRLIVGSDATYDSGNLGGLSLFGGSVDDFGGGSVTSFSTTGLTWAWDGYLLGGPRTVFADDANFGVLAADDETMINLGGSGLSLPRQSAVLEDLLFVGGAAIYGGSRKTAPYSTGSIKVEAGSKIVKGSGTTWNTLVDAGMLLHIGSERVYVVAQINSTTELTLRDAYEGAGGSGKAYSLNPIWTVGSDPYETWEFMTVCANRLVVAFGNVVKFTEVKNPHTFQNSLGTTNEHTLPEGIEIVGLSTVGQTVLIFTTGGIWVLDGLALDITDSNGNAQHTIQLLSSDIVLAGAPGLAGSGQQLVVPAADGIYLMDGVSQPVRVSRPIDRLYRERIEAGYKLGRAVVYRGHYFLPIITTNGVVKNLLVCRLDRPSRERNQTVYPWSRFTGDGGEMAAFAVRSATAVAESILLGAQARKPSQIEDCSAYFTPDEDHEVDADGSCHDFELTTRDYQTGNGTINRVRALEPRYELQGRSNPKVKAYISGGAPKGSAVKYGSGIKYGSGATYGSGGRAFIPVGEAGESDGRNPARFRVNKGLRYINAKIKSLGPASVFALRSLELTTRPSGAPRR